MTAKLQDVRIIEMPDESPDASYLYQEGLGFDDRREAYERGDFGFIGVRAVATIHIPHGDSWIIQTVESPGLWGIESDSGSDYLAEVGEEEESVLRDMLIELGVDLNGLLETTDEPV